MKEKMGCKSFLIWVVNTSNSNIYRINPGKNNLQYDWILMKNSDEYSVRSERRNNVFRMLLKQNINIIFYQQIYLIENY